MILQLREELIITYSWSSNNHGICGHTYEAIDYYLILKDYFDTKILLCEDISHIIFRQVIEYKYNLTKIEIDNILDNTIFYNRPKLLRGNKILFVDGGIEMIESYTLLFNDIYIFGCGDKNIINYVNKYDHKYTILLDHRVYGKHGTNYRKKILFSKLKHVTKSNNAGLLYLTSNCRSVSQNYLDKIKTIFIDKDSFYVSNSNIEGVDVNIAPIDNIFEKFDTYYYTPVSKKFDCSPRFIAECKFYDKQVVYLDIDYLEEDLGLYYRKYDIENDFDSIFLKDTDEIIQIIKGC